MATLLLVAVMLLSVAATAAAAWVWWGQYAWRARAVARRLAAQGVRGPRRGGLLRGCNDEVRRRKAEVDAVAMDVGDHDYLRRIVPHFVAWKEQFGSPFLYWLGPLPRICVFDYDSVKQILSNKYGHFVKNNAHPAILSMIGKGLVLVEGTDWARHRRVLSPAFAMDKLKAMTKTVAGCAECLIKEWENQASNSKSIEIEVEFSKQFQDLTADVICRTAFGSSSEKGKEVFHAQKQLQAIAIETVLNVQQLPGFKYLPTKRNRCMWKLENKLRNTLMQIIQSRITSEGNGYGDDLLGVMLDACFSIEQGEKRDELIMDTVLAWCVSRMAGSAERGGPRGTAIVIPIPMLHQDKEVWGDDADEFNPLRFANGVTRAAKIPHAHLGFSIGPRSCIGQNFAMLEAKSVMAMILQKFSFALSPKYVHALNDIYAVGPNCPFQLWMLH